MNNLIEDVGDMAVEEIISAAVKDLMSSGDDVDSYVINISVDDVDVRRYVEGKRDYIKEEVKRRCRRE